MTGTVEIGSRLLAWLFALCLAVSGLSVPALAEAELRISSPAALDQALTRIRKQDPQPATVLRLAPGSYPRLVLRGLDGPLTIMADDPANPPRITGFVMAKSAGVTFRDILFDYTFAAQDKPLWATPFRVDQSRNLTFERVVFDGDLARGTGTEDDGYPAGKGLVVRNVQGLTIADSEIRGFFLGLSIQRSSDVVFRNNRVHGIRKDGMTLAQVRDVRIESNLFDSFNRAAGSADHADMIQLWTTRTDAASERVTVRDNVFNSGHGHFTQTIFMRNDQVDKGLAGEELFFRDFTIENNVIINAHKHGIAIGAARGLTIRNNTLIRNQRSQAARMNEAWASPQIVVDPRSRDVRIERNAAFRFPETHGPGWTLRQNVIIQSGRRLDAGHYNQIFENALQGDPLDLASFRYSRGGPLAGRGIGASRLDPDR